MYLHIGDFNTVLVDFLFTLLRAEASMYLDQDE